MFFETEKTKTTKFCKIVAIYLFFWGSSVFLVFLFVLVILQSQYYVF